MTTEPIFGAIMCGILAAVYHAVLISPGHILSPLRKVLERVLEFLARVTNYGRSYDIFRWLTKSIVECSWCLAGQLAAARYWYTGGRDLFDMAILIGTSIMACYAAFKYLTSGKG